MEFYDSLINEISSIAKDSSQIITYDSNENLWNDVGYNQVVLQRDTAFELSGTGFNLYTTGEVIEGITVAGCELCDISENRNFSRICIVQLDDCGDEQETYKNIKKVDYVKYHYFPEGYMIRSTSRSYKESVRVAKSALKSGIDFGSVGTLLIMKCKENPKVKAVRVIYITDENIDYGYLEKLAKKAGDITETFNHIMNTVKFDCDVCNLKTVCDEIEGMKELHLKNSSMGG